MAKRLLIAVLLSSAVSAQAQSDGPPPTPAAAPAGELAPKMFEPKFGVVFNLQNIFQNPGLLSGFRGGLGGQFALNPQLALRIGVSLSHSSNPAVVTETTSVINDVTTTTKTMTRPSPTSTFGATLGGDLLAKLTDGALAPYVGGGLWFNVDTSATKWRDDVTVMDQVSSVDDASTGFGVGARGILGVGWRVHPHFTVFAEYALNLTIVDTETETTNQQVTSANNPSASVRSTRSTTRIFDFSTALSQGAALGLIAYF